MTSDKSYRMTFDRKLNANGVLSRNNLFAEWFDNAEKLDQMHAKNAKVTIRDYKTNTQKVTTYVLSNHPISLSRFLVSTHIDYLFVVIQYTPIAPSI